MSVYKPWIVWRYTLAPILGEPGWSVASGEWSERSAQEVAQRMRAMGFEHVVVRRDEDGEPEAIPNNLGKEQE